MNPHLVCKCVCNVRRPGGFMKIAVCVCRCRLVRKGICRWMCVWINALVWVLHFKSDALQPHNHHSSSQRFEHRVAESSQRQLEREWACAQVRALYVMCVIVSLWLCVSCVNGCSVHKGNMRQHIGRGFVISYHSSPALKKMISSDWRLSNLLLQIQSHATCSRPSMKINATPFSKLCNSKCYFTQATPHNRLLPALLCGSTPWIMHALLVLPIRAYPPDNGWRLQ